MRQYMISDKEGKILISGLQKGEGGLDHSFLASIICEQPLTPLHCMSLYCAVIHKQNWTTLNAINCSALQYFSLHCTAILDTALCTRILHWKVLHCTFPLNCTPLQYCTRLQGFAVQWRTLHCTVILNLSAVHCNIVVCLAVRRLALRHPSLLHSPGIFDWLVDSLPLAAITPRWTVPRRYLLQLSIHQISRCY